MSNYQSESGTLLFTKTGYADIVRQTRKAYNDYIMKVRELGAELHAALSKVKGKQKRHQAFKDFLTDETTFKIAYNKHYHISMEHVQLMWAELFRGKDGALTKPRASQFPTMTNKERTPCITVDGDGATFTFSEGRDGSGTLHWHLPENNHAIRKAQSTALFGVVMGVLNQYKWRRNEGGVWHKHDEYTKEAFEDGGALDRTEISAQFGPNGKEARDHLNQRYSRHFR